MPTLKLYFLGSPSCEVNGNLIPITRRKGIALLAYLVNNPQVQRRDLLATLLWPDLGQTSARSALRRELYDVSNTIGSEWIYSTRDELGFNRDPASADNGISANSAAPTFWVDVDEFREQSAGCKRHAPRSDNASADRCDECLAAFTRASELYQGDYLGDLSLEDCPEFGDWQHSERERYHGEFVRLIQCLVQALDKRNDYANAVLHARRWLSVDRLHEPAYRALMHLYAVTGQHAASLRQYTECVRVLENELGIAPSAETTALYQAIRARSYPIQHKSSSGPKDEQFTKPTDTQTDRHREASLPVDPALPSNAASAEPSRPELILPHNLPKAATSFVGRDDEVATIRGMLLTQADCRLLTLIGPGGIGKTRLSLKVAQTLVDEPQEQWQDGIFFVALAAVTDQADVVRSIANAIGYTFQGTDEPKAQLAHFLNKKNLLLVIDNFEHLLDGAQLLSSLLRSAEGLTLLVTSREALDLAEEWLYPLGGLSVPAGNATFSQAEANSAVQLFVQRARRSASNFELSHENSAQVVQICQLVDGMPLGLELAAAWVSTFAIDEIADEIASGLDILASEMRNIPERHRSLRAVFEQTWSRLSEQEQRVLCRLAIFRGSFTRDAAKQVADATTMDVASLVSKALARHENGRYDIHELLRQFALERMSDAERVAVQSEHSLYYGDLLQEQKKYMMTAAEGEMLSTISNHFDNIVAAWRHLVDTIGDASGSASSIALLGQYAPLLAVYFDHSGLFREGQRIFAQALQSARHVGVDDDAFIEPLLMIHLEHASINRRMGKVLAVKEELFEQLPLFRRLDNKQLLAQALTHLGTAYMRLGDFEQAERDFYEAMGIYDELDLELESALALTGIGMLQDRRGLFAESRSYYHTATKIYEQVGYSAGLIRCFINLGTNHARSGEITEAISYYLKAQEIAVETNYQIGLGVISANIGSCEQKLGNDEKSKTHYQEALLRFRELGETRWLTIGLAEYSFSLLALGELEAAAGSLYESLTLVREHQLIVDGLVALAASALLLAEIGESELAVAIATHVMDDSRSKAEVHKYCNDVLNSQSGEMDESDYADAQFRGRSTPFEMMVPTVIDALMPLVSHGE